MHSFSAARLVSRTRLVPSRKYLLTAAFWPSMALRWPRPRRHDLLDQADALSFDAAQEIARHEVALRATSSNQPRPDHRAAVTGNQADRHVWITDLRILCRESHIAQQSQRGAKPDSGPLDRGDDGLADLEHVQHDPPALGEQFVDVVRRAIPQPGEIAAGRKSPRAAGQYDGGGLSVEPHVTKDLRQLPVHLLADRVYRRTGLQRNCEHSLGALKPQRLVVRVAIHHVLPGHCAVGAEAAAMTAGSSAANISRSARLSGLPTLVLGSCSRIRISPGSCQDGKP